jgi:hypothetical protein
MLEEMTQDVWQVRDQLIYKSMLWRLPFRNAQIKYLQTKNLHHQTLNLHNKV